MKALIEKLDAERRNFWHDAGLEMLRAFEDYDAGGDQIALRGESTVMAFPMARPTQAAAKAA